MIAASVVIGTALCAFVFAVVTDERWQKGGTDRLAQLPPVEGSLAQNKSADRRVGPGTSAADLAADTVGSEFAYLADDYPVSDYDPLDAGAGDDSIEPGSIDWLVPNQYGATGGSAKSGAGFARNASTSAGAGSGGSAPGGAGAPGGGAGIGGFGVAGAGAGAGSESGSGDSGLEQASSEQPGERSIFTGLDVVPEPSGADDITQELDGLGAPNFTSLPANFDPCANGGLVVSPCVAPQPDPCSSCGGANSGSGAPGGVASVNGTGAPGAGSGGGESGRKSGGESGGSAGSSEDGETGGSGTTGESGGTGENGDEGEKIQIASIRSSSESDGRENGGGNDNDDRRTPFASSDLRPLLISGGVNPDLTNGEGNEGQGSGENGLLAAASSSATVPVPAPALLLGLGLALLARRR